MSKKDYIGIFGGSFDPIHKGHIESLKSVTEKLNLSKVLVIPNKVSPLKDLSVASSLEKIKMLEIAFSDFKEIEIEDYELKGGAGDGRPYICLLYTSPSPRDRQKSRMPSSA